MNKENIIVRAIDDGYGDVKYSGAEEASLLSSFVSSYKEKPEAELANRGEEQYIASEVNGIKYVVGDYAAKLDPNIKWVGGEDKHSDSRFPILLKTALGVMAQGKVSDIDLLMMNLPIKYDTQERRENLERIARGTHDVGISYDGINFMEKRVNVRNISIKKQPFGSLCELILDDKGDITNFELAKGFNVVVDIGARTVNVLTLDALEEQPSLTTQLNDGMFEVYRQIGDYLERETKGIIPDGKLPKIVRDREVKGLDISTLVDRSYENHANNILTSLDRILVNSWGFVTSVIFTGGGSELLKEYLDKGMRNRNVHVFFLDRFANVKGLKKFGIREASKIIRVKSEKVSIRVGNSYDTEQG